MSGINLKSCLVAGVLALGALAALAPERAAADTFEGGQLSTFSPVSSRFRPGSYYALHRVYLQAGQTYQIDLQSGQFDTYLVLLDCHQQFVASDDDSGGNLNARIRYTVPSSGFYEVMVTSYRAGATGSYGLSVRGVYAGP